MECVTHMTVERIENREGVSTITMWPKAFAMCRIGQDWYENNFEAVFEPGDYYPDYMAVDRFIRENIDGKALNIEEAARLLFDYLMKYAPNRLRVTDHIRSCKTHFPVDVTIE